jgi:hypothetical protein
MHTIQGWQVPLRTGQEVRTEDTAETLDSHLVEVVGHSGFMRFFFQWEVWRISRNSRIRISENSFLNFPDRLYNAPKSWTN